MKLKSLIIIFSILITLLLGMSVISASNNENVILSEESNIDYDVLSSDVNMISKSEDSSNTILKQSSSSQNKIKTKVEADIVVAPYKKNNYFRVEVEDRYDDDIPIEHVQLKITVGSGSKAKTFNVKTNSYGVAKINTKSLKIGTHKVVITTDDEKYDIYKTSKIFVGKQYTKTLKTTAKKVLKNKDVIKLKIKNDYDEKEVKVVLKKAKFTKIIKAKFYLKNKKTGKTIVKTDKVDFDDGRWELPEEDYPNTYSLSRVKVYYISTK